MDQNAPDGGATAGELVGLDIGGTSTQASRFLRGISTVTATAGSANIQNVTRGAASAQLAELFRRLGQEPIRQVIAAAGGVDTDDDAAALRELIAPFAPDADITVVHDSRLILAAGEADHGIAVIAGTGTAAWGRNPDGVEARSGGWGHLLGDEGSAYWLGREAVRHTLRLHDEGQEPDALAAALLLECGLQRPVELISLFHRQQDRTWWAGKSRLVFDAAHDGHEESQQLVRSAAVELSRPAVALTRRLGMSGPIVVGGGLVRHQPALRTAVREILEHAGLEDIRFLDRYPVEGVPRLARAGHQYG